MTARVIRQESFSFCPAEASDIQDRGSFFPDAGNDGDFTLGKVAAGNISAHFVRVLS